VAAGEILGEDAFERSIDATRGLKKNGTLRKKEGKYYY
jgi:hypothetical protein